MSHAIKVLHKSSAYFWWAFSGKHCVSNSCSWLIKSSLSRCLCFLQCWSICIRFSSLAMISSQILQNKTWPSCLRKSYFRHKSTNIDFHVDLCFGIFLYDLSKFRVTRDKIENIAENAKLCSKNWWKRQIMHLSYAA